MTVTTPSIPTPQILWFLRTLGETGLYASADDVGAPLIWPGKPLAMLAYLAHIPDRTATREQLIDLLWSEMPLDAARHSLRQTVWAMRKRFGATLVTVDKRRVTLASRVRCDRDDFIAAVERVDLEGAVGLYRGHFLDRMGAVGGVEYEHWVDAERYRLALLLRRTAEVAIQSRLAQGNTRQAVRIAESVRKLDPGNQALVRLVIESKLADGEVVAARVESDALMETLRRADRQPEPATQRVLTVARRDRDTPREGLTAVTARPRIARPTVMNSLLRAWSTARSGTGQTFYLSGPPGAGKSTLMDAFRRQADLSGAAAVLVSLSGAESAIMYSGAADLAGKLGDCPGALGVSPASATVLVGLNPALSARFHVTREETPTDERLRQRISALSELVVTVAQEGPLVIMIDDFDQCDPSSSQLIEAVTAKLIDQPVLLVASGATRTAGAGFGHAHHLDPLTASEIETYLEGASLGPAIIDEILRITSGQPGHLAALTTQLQSDGALVRPGSSWVCPDRDRLTLLLRQTSRFETVVPQTFRWATALLVTAGTLLGFVIGLVVAG